MEEKSGIEGQMLTDKWPKTKMRGIGLGSWV